MNNTDSSEASFHTPAFTAASVALLFWSGTAVANKVAVVYMDALTAGVLRSMLAGVVATIIAVVLRLPFPASRRDITMLLISGITSFAIWPALLSLGIGYTTAGHAALIMALIPIITVLIAAVINGQKPHPGWWAGAAIALAATAVLVFDRNGSLEWGADGSVMGDLIILLGCLACAIGYVAGGKLSRKLGTTATTFWGLATTLVILVPSFMALAGRTTWSGIPNQGWIALTWMSLLSSIAGYALWFYALGRSGISRIGSLQLIMPVITLAVAALLLDENLTIALLLTCAVIVAGTVLAHRYAGP
jgi:drug/metabolite transporter (DMT)-like permease